MDPDEMTTTKLSIDTIRALAMDAVQKANSGHPGTAMALAPLAYTLFKRCLAVDPGETSWPDRDRFGRHHLCRPIPDDVLELPIELQYLRRLDSHRCLVLVAGAIAGLQQPDQREPRSGNALGLELHVFSV